MAGFQYNEGNNGSVSSNTGSGGTLPFYNNAVADLLGRGQSLLNAGIGMGQYQGPRVAGMTQDQNAAAQGLRDNYGTWQPAMGQATQATGQALQGMTNLQQSPYTQNASNLWTQQQGLGTYNQANVAQYMNPYLNNVVGEIGRLGNENFNQNTLSSINNNFTGAGQFGSARQMAMTADAAAKTQREISAQQGQALYQGQNAAMQNYADWANRGITTNQNAAIGNMGVNQFLQGLNTATGQLGAQYGNLAGQQQQMGFNDYNALYNSGLNQQNQRQKELNASYDAFQQNQTLPWQTLSNYSNLFKVPTASFNSNSGSATSWGDSWNTTFKKGGLARMKEGGGWQVDSDTQEDRDSKRMQLLLEELTANPSDSDLIEEILGMGDTIPSGSSVEGDTWVYRPDQDTFTSSPPPQLDSSLPAQPNLSEELVRLVKEAKSLTPIEEPSLGHKLGRAMLTSAAQGPANWGQLIGRAGTAYYDQEDVRTSTNAQREATKLGLLKGLAPRGGSAGSSLGPEYKYVREPNGTVWMVNSRDPNQKVKIADGNFENTITTMAERAARESLRNATFSTEAERAAALQQRTGEFFKFYRNQLGASAPESSEASSSPAPARRTPPSFWGVSTPEGTILSPKEEKSEEHVGKGLGEQYITLQDNAGAAREKLSSLDEMSRLLKDVNTGKLTPLGTEIAAWSQSVGDALGFDLTLDPNLGNKQAHTALANSFALQLRNTADGAGMPGALSDKDREFLVSQVPSLATSPEGVEALIDIYRRAAERSIKKADLARQYKKENPRGVFDEGFGDYLKNWANQNPLLSDAEKARIQQLTSGKSDDKGSSPRRPAPQIGDVIDGYRLKAFPYTDRNNWERVQ